MLGNVAKSNLDVIFEHDVVVLSCELCNNQTATEKKGYGLIEIYSVRIVSVGLVDAA